jgi:hypothetical protein
MLRRQLPSGLGIDPLLTENEVCAWTGMSLRTLQRKRKDGVIHGIPWNARRYRFKKSEIEHFIEAAEQGSLVRFGGNKHEIAEALGKQSSPAAAVDPQSQGLQLVSSQPDLPRAKLPPQRRRAKAKTKPGRRPLERAK